MMIEAAPRPRSRSPKGPGADGEVKKAMPWENASGGKLPFDEVPDDIRAAVMDLAPAIRERLKRLYNEGTLRPVDLDFKSLMDLKGLAEPLQSKVMDHMFADRVFLSNARSKSGFLVAVCARARRGELDPRGFGAVDPWKQALAALAVPKMKTLSFEPEDEWLEENQDPIEVRVNMTKLMHFGVPMEEACVTLDPTENIAKLKERLKEQGVNVKATMYNVRHVHNANPEKTAIGFLRRERTAAYYNMMNGERLELVPKIRGGRRFSKRGMAG
mmetsp:Transcript_133832/g.303551  ORF Transcript_133832/g.303551 Transcript_133832/m.303551 type:complete len:272 (+) Transcript_133832:81-896(+)